MAHPMKAYQRVRITTASPEELIIMLCEGLVRLTGAAVEALDEQRWADASGNLQKAVEVVNHLRDSLAEDVAPALVATLDRTYGAWTLCLLRAQVARDADKARALVPQMEGMLASWQHITALTAIRVAS